MKRESRATARRVLIIGGLPAEAGGRGSDGLSYSIWNNTKNLDRGSFEFRLLADNALPKGLTLGNVPQAEWGPVGPELLRAVCAARTWTGLCRPYIRDSVKSVGKALWYDRVIRLFKPHLIHVHGALRACLLPDSPSCPPVLTSLHGSIGSQSLTFSHAATVEAEALRRSDALVTVTENTFRRLVGSEHFRGRTWVIPNGIDPTLMSRSLDTKRAHRPIKILTVGSLTTNKNQGAVLEAIRATGLSGCFEYTTVGAGPERENLERFARENGILYRNIAFVAYRDLPRYYVEADFHVLVSHSEGFGQCVAESMACGTPVIISRNMDIAGEPTIINEQSAIVVENNTAPYLATALQRIASGELTRDRRHVAYPYSWSDVASRYMAAYEAMLGEQPGWAREREEDRPSSTAQSSAR
jgi:glycosyltransferase involved in cell wall biosynthesis